MKPLLPTIATAINNNAGGAQSKIKQNSTLPLLNEVIFLTSVCANENVSATVKRIIECAVDKKTFLLQSIRVANITDAISLAVSNQIDVFFFDGALNNDIDGVDIERRVFNCVGHQAPLIISITSENGTNSFSMSSTQCRGKMLKEEQDVINTVKEFIGNL